MKPVWLRTVDVCRKFQKSRSPANAKQFLFKLVGKEWNYETAIDLGLILYAYQEDDEGNSFWQGAEYESEQDKKIIEESRRLEAEEEAKAAEAATEAQRQSAIARQHTERIRKEKEEEMKKREAELAEEEKENGLA